VLQAPVQGAKTWQLEGFLEFTIHSSLTDGCYNSLTPSVRR